MSKMNCIIIEDEPLASKMLTRYISQVPYLELKHTFKNALLVGEYLSQNTIHLIFLDIHLPRLKGMTFLRTLTHPPAVIITTAYHQYAVEGYDLNVSDYLVKPFDLERFLTAVSKVKKAQIEKQNSAFNYEEREHLFITAQKKKVKILFSEIIYIESQKEYVRIVTTRGEHTSKMSTHEIEALLPIRQFIRVHRSFIVSTRKIDSYTAETVEVNGIPIPIGKRYKHITEHL